MERPVKAHDHRAIRTELDVGDAEVGATQVEIAKAPGDIKSGERRTVIPLQVRLEGVVPGHSLGVGLAELSGEVGSHDRTCTPRSRDVSGELTAECPLQVRACRRCRQQRLPVTAVARHRYAQLTAHFFGGVDYGTEGLVEARSNCS